MQIIRKYFPEVIPDNEELYFAHLEGFIDSIDELSSLQITKLPRCYHFRLSTSAPKYNNMVLKELLRFHNMFKIHLDLSKSIKSSGTIMFKISLNDK